MYELRLKDMRIEILDLRGFGFSLKRRETRDVRQEMGNKRQETRDRKQDL
jgi:hypothetical protein